MELEAIIDQNFDRILTDEPITKRCFRCPSSNHWDRWFKTTSPDEMSLAVLLWNFDHKATFGSEKIGAVESLGAFLVPDAWKGIVRGKF